MDSNCSDRIFDIVNGIVSMDEVTMAEWIQLSLVQMMNGNATHVNMEVVYGGGLYVMHHCIEYANPPGDTGHIMEQRQ